MLLPEGTTLSGLTYDYRVGYGVCLSGPKGGPRRAIRVPSMEWPDVLTAAQELSEWWRKAA